MINTRIVYVDPENIDEKVLVEACRVLRNSGLVAFPTETVYGLGALISKRDAVTRIFEVKGRPADNPLIVHVDSVEMFEKLVVNPPETAYRLIDRYWPGPLTIVWWKNKDVVPDEVTAGLSKVAVRSPAHPVALNLINICSEAIAAPSANRSGKPSPTTAKHVIDDLYGLIELIIDSNDTLYGVESTIIDLTTDPPRLLRPGAIPVEDIEKYLGITIDIPMYARGYVEADRAEAPGMKYKHYAPEAKLLIVETDNYSEKLDVLVKTVKNTVRKIKNMYSRIAVICSVETCNEYSDLGVEIINLGSRKQPFIIARNLFKTLRELDVLGIEYAVVEGYEEKGLGLTIMNRLRKASGQNIIRV